MKKPAENNRNRSGVLTPPIEPGSAEIPVLRPRLPRAEQLLPYLRRIDRSRVYTNWGPLALELEARLAEHFGSGHKSVVCASSGTAALAGAILAGAGEASSERPLALMPAYTFIATAAAASMCGYQPYLADIDRETWALNPETLRSHPELSRIGVVVVVSPYGRPIAQEPWRAFREATGIAVVIDGAACFDTAPSSAGAFLGDIPVAMSFHATKCFGSGEGGAIVCPDAQLHKRAVQALNFGFFGSRDSGSASLNGKMSEYHAAVGLAELDGWSEKLTEFRRVGALYLERLQEAGLEERFFSTPRTSASYALFECRNVQDSIEMRDRFEHRRIGHRLWYGEGLHKHFYLRHVPKDGVEVTEDVARRLLGIPWAPDLGLESIERVVSAISQR